MQKSTSKVTTLFSTLALTGGIFLSLDVEANAVITAATTVVNSANSVDHDTQTEMEQREREIEDFTYIFERHGQKCNERLHTNYTIDNAPLALTAEFKSCVLEQAKEAQYLATTLEEAYKEYSFSGSQAYNIMECREEIGWTEQDKVVLLSDDFNNLKACVAEKVEQDKKRQLWAMGAFSFGLLGLGYLLSPLSHKPSKSKRPHL